MKQNHLIFQISQIPISMIAKASRRDHNPPERLIFLYLSKAYEINSGFKWSICTSERWTVSPAFADKILVVSKCMLGFVRPSFEVVKEGRISHT